METLHESVVIIIIIMIMIIIIWSSRICMENESVSAADSEEFGDAFPILPGTNISLISFQNIGR